MSEQPYVAEEPSPELKNLLKNINGITNSAANYMNGSIREKMFPFDSHFIRRLLYNKHIILIGDSLTRGLYKDLIVQLQSDDLISDYHLKLKTEVSHYGDRQIDILPLESDRIFRQAREYMTPCNLIQYIFTTRVMKDDVEQALLTIFKTKEYPDVLILNSAIWDMTRYNIEPVNISGLLPDAPCPRAQIRNELMAMEEYLERLSMLMRRLRVILPPTTQVIWALYPWPLPDGRGIISRVGTIDKRSLHRSLYNDGNYRAAQIVRNAGYDVLDFGFYLRNHALHTYRSADGVHWSSVGTRIMTQLLIGHLSMNICLPSDITKNFNEFKDNTSEHGPKFFEIMNKCAVKDQNGNYSEKLQQKLRETFLNNLDENFRNSLKSDIQLMRFVDLVKREELLDVVDTELSEYIIGMLTIKRLIVPEICKNNSQRIMISVNEKFLKKNVNETRSQ